MPVEVKTNPNHPSSMTQRIRDRLKHSGGGPERAAETVQVGSGPNRTITAIHRKGNQQHNVRPQDTGMPSRAGGVGMPKGQSTGPGRTGYFQGGDRG
jgi:hypothetical protein